MNFNSNNLKMGIEDKTYQKKDKTQNENNIRNEKEKIIIIFYYPES